MTQFAALTASAFDREACRLDIDAILADPAPHRVQNFFTVYGEELREMLLEYTSVDDVSEDLNEELNQIEKKADAYVAAFDDLMEAVDTACDELNEGERQKDIYEKLFRASSRAAEVVKEF